MGDVEVNGIKKGIALNVHNCTEKLSLQTLHPHVGEAHIKKLLFARNCMKYQDYTQSSWNPTVRLG